MEEEDIEATPKAAESQALLRPLDYAELVSRLSRTVVLD